MSGERGSAFPDREERGHRWKDSRAWPAPPIDSEGGLGPHCLPSEVYRRGHYVGVDAGLDFLTRGDATIDRELLRSSNAVRHELQDTPYTSPNLRSSLVTIELIADALRSAGQRAIASCGVAAAVEDDRCLRAARADHGHLRGSVELQRRVVQQWIVVSEGQIGSDDPAIRDHDGADFQPRRVRFALRGRCDQACGDQ